MMGRSSLTLLIIFAIVSPHGESDARVRSLFKAGEQTPIVESGPTLAPFQHVRFCLRYPADCRSNTAESEQIDLNAERLGLIERVNLRVNASIASKSKAYGRNLDDAWTIAPERGDCNDYAVTKRHELLKSGLPSRALRLSVVRTVAGRGHLVLVVMTTKGGIVMDSLTDAIRTWQTTDYRWLKIQSANDPRYWLGIRAPVVAPCSDITANTYC
jgi:predicted transglutaminase-like cysteine proteinase